jgi:hypothetical protein
MMTVGLDLIPDRIFLVDVYRVFSIVVSVSVHGDQKLA